MSKFIDLAGLKFGKLTVLSIHNRGKSSRWNCLCDCGNECIVLSNGLRRGISSSCGCDKGEKISQSKLQHGCYFENERLAGIWEKMKRRCMNPKDTAYHNYGGRGIKVCDEWIASLRVFFDWALAAGYQPHLTIDRIDTNGNYEPNNCRWITLKENNQNRRNTLGWEKVIQIKHRLKAGESAKSLSAFYGVGLTCIWGIKKGRYYSNVII